MYGSMLLQSSISTAVQHRDADPYSPLEHAICTPLRARSRNGSITRSLHFDEILDLTAEVCVMKILEKNRASLRGSFVGCREPRRQSVQPYGHDTPVNSVYLVLLYSVQRQTALYGPGTRL